MADQRNTKDDVEVDYRKPSRVNRKKGKSGQRSTEHQRVRQEAYHRERFDTRHAIDLLDDDEL